LPGKPDIVLGRYKVAVFVNGCFWHQHSNCPRSKRPASRLEYWDAKLDRNVARDMAVNVALEALGWRVTIIWECELAKASKQLISELKKSRV